MGKFGKIAGKVANGLSFMPGPIGTIAGMVDAVIPDAQPTGGNFGAYANNAGQYTIPGGSGSRGFDASGNGIGSSPMDTGGLDGNPATSGFADALGGASNAFMGGGSNNQTARSGAFGSGCNNRPQTQSQACFGQCKEQARQERCRCIGARKQAAETLKAQGCPSVVRGYKRKTYKKCGYRKRKSYTRGKSCGCAPKRGYKRSAMPLFGMTKRRKMY